MMPKICPASFAVGMIAPTATSVLVNRVNPPRIVQIKLSDRVNSGRRCGAPVAAIGRTRYFQSMCGRYAMDQETDQLINEFVATGGDFRNWRPSWNISPTQTIPVLIHSATGDAEPVRRLEPARWSLTPSWSTELKTKFPT